MTKIELVETETGVLKQTITLETYATEAQVQRVADEAMDIYPYTEARVTRE